MIKTNEGLSLRGLGIILIVFHNVTHLLCGAYENEFTFIQENANYFINHWTQAPFTFLFSYYGWVGVSVFVFLSGYGLTVKYANSKINIYNWLRKHYLKLMFLLFPALLFLFFAGGYGDEISKYQIKTFIIEQLLLLNIIHPSGIWPGIYWYLGMAFQLYIIFLLIRKLDITILSVVGVLTCVVLVCAPMEYMFYLRHNFIGWLPEFIFGSIYCRLIKNSKIRITKKLKIILTIVFFFLFVTASFNRYIFFMTGIFFVVVLLSFKHLLVKIPAIQWIGRISAGLYVVHAVVRQLWFNSFSVLSYFDPIVNAFIIMIISVIISIPYQYYYSYVVKGQKECTFIGTES